MAVAHAYCKSYHRVHIFCDSESTLKSFTDTEGGRMTNVNTCRILRDWFERHPENHLHVHYCPSHSGIEENEAVDADVKWKAREPGRLPPGPQHTSYAYARHNITGGIAEYWQRTADKDPRASFGRFHLRHPSFQRLRHTGPFPLKRLGGRPTLVARFIRCITDHGPTGRYRDRFRAKHQEATFCFDHKDGRGHYHTREHVLFGCDRYERRYQYSRLDELLQSMDPFYEIQRFLQDNPAAMSFEDLPGE